jgi:ceramide glucosyltransferase
MVTSIAIALVAASMCCMVLFAAMIVLHAGTVAAHDLNLPFYPKTSVFLTLRSLDDGLEENLTSVFSLDYPDFDVYFAVDAMDDPCVQAAQRVRARFPAIKTAILQVDQSQAHNPKVNKLARLEEQSDAPLVWVLDSDVRVDSNALRALVSEHLHHGAKMVFSPIRCQGARTFGSVVEMSYVNFFMSGSILTTWKLFRKRVVVGKSLLIERKALDAVGGFACFADVLAEDYWLGETFAKRGFSVQCGKEWIDTIKETTTIKTYFSRMGRWAKLRFNLVRPIYLLEILLNPLALVLVFLPLLKTSALPLALIVIFVRVAMEYLAFFAINHADRRRIAVILALAPAALAKDLLMLFVYFIPFFSNTVAWRGNTIRIGNKTRITFNQENSSL